MSDGPRGELGTRLLVSRLAPPSSGEPPGTLSEIVVYLAGPQAVAMSHRYWRPDGTLGGSGVEDPKWLFESAEILAPAHRDAEVCPDCTAWRRRAAASKPQ